MLLSSEQRRLELPESLRVKMVSFRRRVWTIKLIEAGCGAVFGVLAAYLVLFVLDRLMDTPAGARGGIFAAAMLSCAIVPLVLHRWIWRQRRTAQRLCPAAAGARRGVCRRGRRRHSVSAHGRRVA